MGRGSHAKHNEVVQCLDPIMEYDILWLSGLWRILSLDAGKLPGWRTAPAHRLCRCVVLSAAGAEVEQCQERRYPRYQAESLETKKEIIFS